jgi:hypothetical protein
VRRATVNRIESGLPKSIYFVVLEKLAGALGIDPALLISRQAAWPAPRAGEKPKRRR